jgi:hypothetical protein
MLEVDALAALLDAGALGRFQKTEKPVLAADVD